MKRIIGLTVLIIGVFSLLVMTGRPLKIFEAEKQLFISINYITNERTNCTEMPWNFVNDEWSEYYFQDETSRHAAYGNFSSAFLTISPLQWKCSLDEKDAKYEKYWCRCTPKLNSVWINPEI